VTVQGGNTGLVSGAVPVDTVVLCTRRLAELGPVEDGTVVAGAGVTLAQVQAHAKRAGWDYGVDMASRDSCTVGGTVVTNAGGIHVVAHGTTRAQVMGVEVVLADGSVVSRLGRADQGRDRLRPRPPRGRQRGHPRRGHRRRGCGWCRRRPRSRRRWSASGRSATPCRWSPTCAGGPRPARRRARAAGRHRAGAVVLPGLPEPLGTPAAAYVVLEAASGLLDALEDAPQVLDAAVAADAGDAARLWAYRERMTESISRLGVPHKLDVSLPFAALEPVPARPAGRHRRLDRAHLRPRRRRQPARQRARPGARRRVGRRSGARAGGVLRRVHRRRARGGEGQAGVPAPLALAGRARRHARAEGRPGPGGLLNPGVLL
jgi:hypothetical protein